MNYQSTYNAVVIGVSAGGMEVLSALFSSLPKDSTKPFIVVQHLHPSEDGFMVDYFNSQCPIPVKEAVEKEKIHPGQVYFAPANYHLMIEMDHTFSLSVDEKVNYSRPSIDVMFESAADAWPNQLIGIILTGASFDGAKGICAIKKSGGFTIAQSPETAMAPVMPQAAIDTGMIDEIMSIEEISRFVRSL